MADFPLSHRSWMEDGILYMEYHGEVTVSRVLENQKSAMTLLSQRNIQTIPAIVIFNNVDKTRFKVTMADYGKIIASFDLPKHISGVWIVGATAEVKKIIGVVNKMFFSNRLHLIDDLYAAQKAAKLLPLSSPSILE